MQGLIWPLVVILQRRPHFLTLYQSTKSLHGNLRLSGQDRSWLSVPKQDHVFFENPWRGTYQRLSDHFPCIFRCLNVMCRYVSAMDAINIPWKEGQGFQMLPRWKSALRTSLQLNIKSISLTNPSGKEKYKQLPWTHTLSQRKELTYLTSFDLNIERETWVADMSPEIAQKWHLLITHEIALQANVAFYSFLNFGFRQ